ncbi:hypothetical protein EZ449_03590 [Pedobacter frigidisoli]|uniref:Uncharacterized protein n=1 Tax=Pedobacter frigidisoli TaxID=2530455 RepID=A0A4R0P5G1_9SPHI|nr:hypothetical protein [Pedobacter frigidisoli]TCD12112.1 hypothetical protein EZ449_03590 [Pedobacter frigidisoli]
MTFEFSDEDGFISVVNTNKYQGFVDDDWQFDQLLNHFVNQMNDHNIIVWASNEDGGNEWKIDVLNQPSSNKEFSNFSFPISVTNGSLYLVSYNDLTMAAQFEDEVLPSKYNAHLKIDLSNGLYNVTVRQMFNPKNLDYEAEMVHFELIFILTTEAAEQKANNVFWYTA